LRLRKAPEARWRAGTHRPHAIRNATYCGAEKTKEQTLILVYLA
jgi:hypothetical protein